MKIFTKDEMFIIFSVFFFDSRTEMCHVPGLWITQQQWTNNVTLDSLTKAQRKEKMLKDIQLETRLLEIFDPSPSLIYIFVNIRFTQQ